MGAINHIDAVKPNGYSQAEKIRWLSTLDGTIKAEIVDTHEGAEGVEFKEYNDNTPLTHVLLIPHPYDDVYIKWLEAQIDYANGEYGKYNNSITMFNAAYSSLEKYYNRTHKPIAKNFTHF
jgi:hypothetical protein